MKGFFDTRWIDGEKRGGRPHEVRVFGGGGSMFSTGWNAGDQNLWPELEGIVTFERCREGWVRHESIRIYDLNWKGLWLSERMEILDGNDIDQNLWPELEGIVTLLCGRVPRSFSLLDQNLWPELEGIVTMSVGATILPPLLYQNLWPELEGIVTIDRDRDLGPMISWSEFMTWIGRDCDVETLTPGQGFPLNQNLWPELEGIVTQLRGVVLTAPLPS